MKFLADRTLGKLAKGLRMLGYDTLYYRGEDIHQLIHLARQEDRILLTRNTKLALRRPKDRIITITEDSPSRQLKEVVQKETLSLGEEKLYTRCLLCNDPIDAIPREEAEGKVPDFIFHQQKDFFRCPRCERIYWQGSHLTHMNEKVKELIENFKYLKSKI
ncbi:MAG: Mut7-C RNAse domain-containing protein [Syntrophaceae bacterium]|nr:Mut7-C RNAse domain-containing protein [Syntrophaceae bacterium]